MSNNAAFANHIEQLILSDNLTDAGMDLSSFLKQFNATYNSVAARDLQQQLTEHLQNLKNVNHRVRHKQMSESQAAAVEKNIWVAFHHINNQIRNLSDFDTENPQSASEYTPTYVGKPQTWREAGWLPLFIAGCIVAVAFTVGLSYNSARIKARKKAEQAAIDAKNGVLGRVTEGSAALRLLEEKSTTGLEGAVIFTVKKVNATDSTLELVLKNQNKSKSALQNVHYVLIDNAQKEVEIQALEKDNMPVESAAASATNSDKKIHFRYAVGDSRSFLLLCKFTTAETPAEKTLLTPFQLY